MRWLDSMTNSGHQSEQTLGDSEGRGSLTCCSPQGCRVGQDLGTAQQYQTPMNKSACLGGT